MIISIAALTEALARLEPTALLLLLRRPDLAEDYGDSSDSDRILYDMLPEDMDTVMAEGPRPGSLVGARVPPRRVRRHGGY